jgi:pimeloyl-ACP methyl ester carboxylesterase
MKLLLALSLLLVGCASSPKAARKWTEETVKNSKEKTIAIVTKTGGKTAGTMAFGHGLLDDVLSPGTSKYDTKGIVEAINAAGYASVVALGYEHKIAKSDPAFMLRLDPGHQSVHQYVAELARIIAEKKIQRPLACIGVSMGGSNLLTLAAQYPEMCDSLILLNPMILRADQWSDRLLDFSRPLGEIDPALMSGNHFTKEEWATANPFSQLERATKLPRMLVTACKQDAFKLFDATEAWVKAAQAKGFDVTWVPNSGCSHTSPRTLEIPGFLK